MKHPELVVSCHCGEQATVTLVTVTGYVVELCPQHAGELVDPLGVGADGA